VSDRALDELLLKSEHRVAGHAEYRVGVEGSQPLQQVPGYAGRCGRAHATRLNVYSLP